MCAGRHDTQHVLGEEDRQKVGEHGARHGREEQVATRFDQRRKASQKVGGLVHMLDDFHRCHDVIRAPGQRLGRRRQVRQRGWNVVFCTLANMQGWITGRVHRRYADIVRRSVDARHTRAQPRRRLGQDAAATPDVEHTASMQKVRRVERQGHIATQGLGDGPVPAAHFLEFFAHELDTDAIHRMQRRKLALLIPPLVRQAREVRNVPRVHGRRRVHGAPDQAAMHTQAPRDGKHKAKLRQVEQSWALYKRHAAHPSSTMGA